VHLRCAIVTPPSLECWVESQSAGRVSMWRDAAG
jgi:hypothetical protein